MKFISKIKNKIVNETVDLVRKVTRRLQNSKRIKKDFNLLRGMEDKSRNFKGIDKKDFSIYFNENTESAAYEPHYTYHASWAARIIKKINPTVHYDVSSCVLFNTIVSAFIPVKFYDYRPLEIKLDNLETYKGDLLNLPFESNSIQCLSCMHVIEHIGLGRYGDPIDYNGDLKAMEELKRVVSPGGNLLVVVPMGGDQSKICFNAHRIYSYDSIVGMFSGFQIKEFSLIKNEGYEKGMIENAKKEDVVKEKFGCGCFWLVKQKL